MTTLCAWQIGVSKTGTEAAAAGKRVQQPDSGCCNALCEADERIAIQ
jgi:hypothetical protein